MHAFSHICLRQLFQFISVYCDIITPDLMARSNLVENVHIHVFIFCCHLMSDLNFFILISVSYPSKTQIYLNIMSIGPYINLIVE